MAKYIIITPKMAQNSKYYTINTQYKVRKEYTRHTKMFEKNYKFEPKNYRVIIKKKGQ